MNWKRLSAQKKQKVAVDGSQSFPARDLSLVVGRPERQNFCPTVGQIVRCWQCFFYVTDGWSVYPCFIAPGDQIVSKTYMTRA